MCFVWPFSYLSLQHIRKMVLKKNNKSHAWVRLSLRECKSKDNKEQGSVETSNNTNTNIFLFSLPTKGMGALLNNSNGCPRMPIRNTTAIKAVSILCAEWRPLQQMKALFLLSSGGWSHTSIFFFFCLSFNLFLYLFAGCNEGEMFRFWSRTYLRGESNCQPTLSPFE